MSLTSRRTGQDLKKQINLDSIKGNVFDTLLKAGIIFQRPITSKNYSFDYSEDIDPQLALENKPFYRHISTGTRPQLKKVVFADWRINHLPKQLIREYEDTLHRLLYEVESYIWDGQKLVQARDTNDLISLLPSLVPAPTKQLIEECQKIGIVRDQVLILNYSCSNKILLSPSLWEFNAKFQDRYLDFNCNLDNLHKTFFLRDLLLLPEKEWANILKLEDCDFFEVLDLQLYQPPEIEPLSDVKIFNLIKTARYFFTDINTLTLHRFEDLSFYLPYLGLLSNDKINKIEITAFARKDAFLPKTEQTLEMYSIISKQFKNKIEFVIDTGIEDEIEDEKLSGPLHSTSKYLEKMQQMLPHCNVTAFEFKTLTDREPHENFYFGFTQLELNPAKSINLKKVLSSKVDVIQLCENTISSIDSDHPGTIVLHSKNIYEFCDLSTALSELVEVRGCQTLHFYEFNFLEPKYPINNEITKLHFDNCEFNKNTANALFTAFPNLISLTIKNTEVLEYLSPDVLAKIKLLDICSIEYKTDMKILFSALAKMKNLHILNLSGAILDNIRENDECLNNRICPQLVKASLNPDVFFDNKSLFYLIQKLPKKLKFLDIHLHINYTKAQYNEAKKSNPLSVGFKNTIDKLVNNRFENLGSHFTHFTEHLFKTTNDDELNPNDELELDADTDDTDNSNETIISIFKPNASVRFSDRHTRKYVYSWNPTKKAYSLDNDLDQYEEIATITDNQIGKSAHIKLKTTFNSLYNSKIPLIYYAEQIEIEPDEFLTLSSPGPESELYTQKEISSGENEEKIRIKKQLCFVSSHPVILFRNKETGFYGIQLTDDYKQSVNLTLSAIYYHPPCTFKWSILGVMSHRIKAMKFDENAKLDVNTIDNHLQEYKFAPNKLFSHLTVYFREFRAKKIEIENKDKQKIANTLFYNQVGVCRHRSELFAKVAEGYNFQHLVRIPVNRNHEWIEVKNITENKWQRVELRTEKDDQANTRIKTLPMLEFDDDIDFTASNSDSDTEEKSMDTTKDDMKKVVATYLKNINQISALNPKLFFKELDNRLEKSGAGQALLILPQEEHRFNFYYHLCNEMTTSKICIVDNLDDIAVNDLILTEQNKPKLIPARVHRFLKSAKKDDILILNFINLKSQHVGYNTAINCGQRELDGTNIPADVRVIVITTQEKYQLLREDMVSRFPRTEGLVIKLPFWPKIIVEKNKSETEFKIINDLTEKQNSKIASEEKKLEENISLKEREDWNSVLIGEKKLVDGQFELRQGSLLGLSPKTKLGIINPPENNDDCKLFCATGQYEFNGGDYQWQAPIITKVIAYEYNTECLLKTPAHNATSIDWVLNTTSFRYLLPTQGYSYEKQVTVNKHSILDQLPDKANILINSTLTNGQFAQLLDLCKEKQKAFYFQRTANVKVPSKLNKFIPLSSNIVFVEKEQNDENEPREEKNITSNVSIIDTNDPSFFIAKHADENSIVFALENRLNTDLIEYWQIQRQQSEPDQIKFPKFNLLPGQILRALDNNKTVILHGIFSKELQNTLGSLFSNPAFVMFNGERKQITKGKLIILSNNAEEFEFVKLRQNIRCELNDKLALLEKQNGKNEKFIHFKNAIINAPFEHEPRFDSLCALWKGYLVNEMETLKTYHQLTSKKANEKFPVLDEESRLKRLCYLLQNMRSVFLIGPSSSGKSSTILNNDKLKKYLSNSINAEVKIFVNLEKVSDWIQYSQDKEMRILFVDEANLVQGLNALLGINDPLEPHIILNGNRIPLQQNHKIIFAGNGLNYEGRENHPILECAQPLFFGECSFEQLFQKQIAPILEIVVNQEQDRQMLFKEFKFVYDYVRSEEKNGAKLITTRNLEMMAMLTAYMSKLQTDLSLEAIAKIAGYQTARYLIPMQTEIKLDLKLKEELKEQNFLLTPTHQPTIEAIMQLLSIRCFTSTYTQFLQLGIRGLLIEGPSGIGKSTVVVSYLKHRGYKQAYVETKPDESQSYFCILTPTKPAKMLSLLNTAFHNGWIVILDEINTMPIEEWLNAFMSGVDLNGQPAKHPGFGVIGTMNPGNFPGRQKLSPAFRNRFREITLRDYLKDEIIQILQFNLPTISFDKVEYLSELYLQSKLSGEIPFTIRDLLRIVDKDFKLQTATEVKANNANSARCNNTPINKPLTPNSLFQKQTPSGLKRKSDKDNTDANAEENAKQARTESMPQ